MSTNDVPGANSANADKLAMGCWAEADAGTSLLFVLSNEGGDVIYSMFDLSRDPVLEYRDKMPQKEFKDFFTWKKGSIAKWTWHDKTPFPWDKVIKRGLKDGVRSASAVDTLAEAGRVSNMVAEHLGLKASELDPEVYADLMEKEEPRKIIQMIQRSIDACGTSDKKKVKKLKKLLDKQKKIDLEVQKITK